jgi:hypothetical protein
MAGALSYMHVKITLNLSNIDDQLWVYNHLIHATICTVLPEV